jgi:phosphoglycerate-specific signal transduction histidine kinase
LQQVFHNLIMNAAEAMVSVTDRARLLVVTSGGGEDGEVRITVWHRHEGYRQDLPCFLHDQIARHGHGTRHLPLDHRGA